MRNNIYGLLRSVFSLADVDNALIFPCRHRHPQAIAQRGDLLHFRDVVKTQREQVVANSIMNTGYKFQTRY
jgi:hypothetical protein